MTSDNVRGSDWSVLDEPEVREVIESAARAAGERLGHLRSHYDSLDTDNAWIGSDVEQEALILVATKPALREAASQPALLHTMLFHELMNFYRTEVRRASKAVSHSGIEGGLAGLEELDTYVTVDAPKGGYNRESVQELLPAIWDESYCYGLDRKPNVPDPDMPRTRANPAHGNNLAAAIADIRIGWERAELTTEERRALFLAHGVGWTQKQAAFNQGVSQAQISRRVQNGIAKIVAHLNGGEWHETEDQEEVSAA